MILQEPLLQLDLLKKQCSEQKLSGNVIECLGAMLYHRLGTVQVGQIVQVIRREWILHQKI